MLLYVPPHIDFWSAADLDSIEATMSGGYSFSGGYSSSSYYAYLLVNTKAVAGFGHGALAVIEDNSVIIFSFAGNGLEEVILNENRISGFLTQGMAATMTSYTDTRSSFLSGSKYYGDDRYDIGLRMQINKAQYENIVAEGARRLYMQNKKYSLLNYNCMDCALDLLSEAGVSFSWERDTQNVVMACASAFTALFGAAAFAALQSELAKGKYEFTVPKSVVQGLTGYLGSFIDPPKLVSFR